MKNIIVLTVILIICFSGFIVAETYYVQDYTSLLHKPNGETIGMLRPGFEVENILGYEGNWWKIRIKEHKGYADGWIKNTSLSTTKPSGNTDNSSLEDSFESDGFTISNVSFNSYVGMTKVIGEVKNNTDKNFSFATFIVSVYDGDKLIATGNIIISNISNDQKKSFEGLIDVPFNAFDNYNIQFETGY